MMVVSEMGEQWSPQTAPAMQAEMEMIISSFERLPSKTLTTIGMRMPNVPQDVPVAKLRPQPIRKMIAGSSDRKLPAEPRTSAATYCCAPSESVIALSVHANVKIRMAGTMDLKPSGMASMHSVNFITRVARKKMMVRIMAMTEP